MKSGDEQRRAGKEQRGSGKGYRIVVRGELSRRYAAAFEGMQMETKTGRTVLAGVIDQPHLHGILARINALGLELLSVEYSYPEKKTEQAGSTGGAAAPRQSPRPT